MNNSIDISNYTVCKVSSSNYSSFFKLAQERIEGSAFLPEKWGDELWGVILYCGSAVEGGWVGKKRISNNVYSLLYQEIVFDSYPVISKGLQDDDIVAQTLVEECINYAKRWGICSLKLSHWVRGYQVFNEANFYPQKYASFIIDLNGDYFYKYDYSQRYTIHKAQKNNVSFAVYRKYDALKYLEDFQRIRKETQARAIMNNKDASMLLKHNEFFESILMNCDSILVIVRTKEGNIGSMGILLKTGKTLYYGYAGSDLDLDRKYGCSSYMTGMFIDYAKQIGCDRVDMGGCPVSPSEASPAYGVYRFKKSFGGDYQEYIGGDFIVNKLRYRLAKLLINNVHIRRLISKKI